MTRTRFICLAAVLVLASGCNTMRAMGKQQHQFTINAVPDGPAGCRISHNSIPPVNVGNKNSAVITFDVSPDDEYEFAPTDGVKFLAKQGGSAPKDPDEFKRTNPGNNKRWVINDRNQESGTFAYEINVVRKSSGNTCKLDPIVNNDGTCISDCVP